MEITIVELQQFITAYESAYGITLSEMQAQREASTLFQLYKILYLTPLPPQVVQKTATPRLDTT